MRVLDILGWGKTINCPTSPESFNIFISVADADKLKLRNYQDVENYLNKKFPWASVIEVWTDGTTYYNEKGKKLARNPK